MEMHGLGETLPTAEELWTALMNMLNQCYDGKHEDGPWVGLPLCGGKVRLVVWVVTGDLEYLGNELKYPHFNSNDPCSFCPASRRHLGKIKKCTRKL